MNRALLWPMLMLASRAECWQVVGAASQPNQAGSLSLGSLPNATTHVRLHHLNASGTFVAATIAVVADAITWAAALPPGQYVLMALPAGVIANRSVHLHTGYTLAAVVAAPVRFSAALCPL